MNRQETVDTISACLQEVGLPYFPVDLIGRVFALEHGTILVGTIVGIELAGEGMELFLSIPHRHESKPRSMIWKNKEKKWFLRYGHKLTPLSGAFTLL